MYNIFIAAGLLPVSGILAMVLPRRLRPVVFIGAVIAALGFASSPVIPFLMTFVPPAPHQYAVRWPWPFGEIGFTLDPLAAFFVVLILVALLLIAFGSSAWNRAAGAGSRFHYLFIGIMGSAMLLLVAVENLLVFLFFWEIMTVAAFALIMENSSEIEFFPFRINWFTAMHVGMLFILIPVLIIMVKTGESTFSAFAAMPAGRAGVLFLMLFVGFAFKAEFVPFHPWLPQVHPALPPHVSGLFSGVMMKMGIYGIIRTALSFGALPAWCAWVVTALAVFTALYGILHALPQRDVRKALAYSSIENMGIAGLGIGAGMLSATYGYYSAAVFAFTGALIHCFNHAVFKPMLFSAFGAVERITGTRDMERLGGMMKVLPFAGWTFLLGSAAISGMPLFSGFAGEFCIYLGLLKGTVQAGSIGFVLLNLLSVAFLALSGAVALITFTKLFSIVFLGSYRGTGSPQGKTGTGERVQLALAALLCLGVGLFPHYAAFAVKNAVEQMAGSDITILFISAFSLLKKLSFVSVSMAVFMLLAVLLRRVLVMGRTESAPTWGCGYPVASPRLQYTGFSFAENLSMLLGRFVDVRERRSGAEGLFPSAGSFVYLCFDSFDSRFFKPLMKQLRSLFGLFSDVQGGRTQIYILYGVIFAIAAALWMIAGN